MTFTTEDRVQAWTAFLEWWHSQYSPREEPDAEARQTAGAAWIAACQWSDTLRSDG